MRKFCFKWFRGGGTDQTRQDERGDAPGLMNVVKPEEHAIDDPIPFATTPNGFSNLSPAAAATVSTAKVEER